jgi:hypothetical protein
VTRFVIPLHCCDVDTLDRRQTVTRSVTSYICDCRSRKQRWFSDAIIRMHGIHRVGLQQTSKPLIIPSLLKTMTGYDFAAPIVGLLATLNL